MKTNIMMAIQFAKEYPRYVLAFALILAFAISWAFQEAPKPPKEPTPAELEQRLKEEIRKLDAERNFQKNSLKNLIRIQTDCIGKLEKEIGTTIPTWKCGEIKPVIPVANAEAPEDYDKILMDKICNTKDSPLCGNWELYRELKKITEDRIPNGGQWFAIQIGMTNAESSLGTNFANDNKGGKCDGRNNWGGAKYQILDDNSRVYNRNINGFYYTYDKNKKTDQYGCYLFPFESVQEYWTSKTNGIRYGYKGCIDSDKPIECIAYKYVGNPNIAEPSWIKNVARFTR